MSTMPMTPRQRSPLAIALESIIPGGQADPSTQALAPRSRGQMIAGILSDGVKGYLGQEGTFGATLAAEQQARRQAQAAEVKWQRDRVAGREDKQWEWQNKPKDDKPYRFQDNAGNLIELGPDGQPRTVFTDPTPKINYQRVNNPDGTFTMVPIPMGGVPAAPAPTTPTAPVGKLRPITGGAVPPASRPFSGPVPQKLKTGFMTSGRRTPKGNALVGGVPNSAHLRGDAVDYDGPDLNALLAEVRQTMNPDKAFIHRGHVHTEKRGLNAPYFGKNGTAGLRKR